MWGILDISKSTTVGREPVEGIGSNESLLGRRMVECFGDAMPILCDSNITGRALFAGRILEIK